MYPQAHGIVGNRFFDPDRGEHFSYRDRATAQDGTWWQGEPIWVTAETQGMVTGAFFFPGTEAAIRGIRPTYWKPYNGQVPNTDRIQQVLDWLSLPVNQRPHLVTLYFSLVDSAGHNIGPDSPEMQHSVEQADELLGQLITGINSLGHAKQVAVVVVSDHGMATPNANQFTLLPETINLSNVRTVPVGPMMALHTGNRRRSLQLRDELNDSLDNARAYLREDIPAHLHHRSNRRIGDIVVIPEGTGMVRSTSNASVPAGGTQPPRTCMAFLWHQDPVCVQAWYCPKYTVLTSTPSFQRSWALKHIRRFPETSLSLSQR
jgi:alkaline phosphatase D